MNTNSGISTRYLWLVGIFLVVLGIIAITSPAIAGTTVVFIIGGVLLVAGLMQLLQGYKEKKLSSKLFSMVLGVVAILCGIAVIARPVVGMDILAILIAIFFVLEGIWKIIYAFSFRPAGGWLFVLASGIVCFLLGLMIWKQWPLSGEYAVGILVGVDLLVTGISMIALARTVNRINKAAAT